MYLFLILLCCISAISHGCFYGQIRLVNGGGPNVGRLEICRNNIWELVCNNDWSYTNAQVVCRQLGHPTDGATVLNETYFGAGNGSILLGDIVCSGSESTILQCTHSSVGSHNCGPNDTVGIQCAESINNVSVCDTELSDQLWTLMRANGNCEQYYKTGFKGFCDDFYDPGVTYVYIPKRRLGGSQTLLRQFSEQANVFLIQIPSHCREIAKNVLCTHYYLPCGFNGTLHVPLPLCPDVCRYMSETLCPDIWSFVATFLISNSVDPEYRNDEGVKLPVLTVVQMEVSYYPAQQS
uniref:SRCR domain-containing protein n=1 Tax=Amphimedon queenslandica TaxID=400682 RepID=A0A1X7TUZ9_AMPQE